MDCKGSGDSRRGTVAEWTDVEKTLVQHVVGAIMTFLSWLEHEQHSTVQLGFPSTQQSRCAGEHGGVRIVAARMHHVVDSGTEIDTRVLGHRQGIHVAPQKNRGTGTRTLERRDDPRGCLVESDSERESLERGQHLVTCSRQMIAELGPLMKSTTHGDGIIQEVPGLVVDGGEIGGFAHGSIVDTVVDGVVTEEMPNRGALKT